MPSKTFVGVLFVKPMWGWFINKNVINSSFHSKIFRNIQNFKVRDRLWRSRYTRRMITFKEFVRKKECLKLVANKICFIFAISIVTAMGHHHFLCQIKVVVDLNNISHVVLHGKIIPIDINVCCICYYPSIIWAIYCQFSLSTKPELSPSIIVPELYIPNCDSCLSNLTHIKDHLWVSEIHIMSSVSLNLLRGILGFKSWSSTVSSTTPNPLTLEMVQTNVCCFFP